MAIVLSDYLRCAGTAPFGYRPGDLDCSRFVRGWIEAVRGAHGLDRFGDYRSEAEAKRIVRAHGGLRKLGHAIAEEHGFAVTTQPTAGDIGIVRHGRTLAFAICTAGSYTRPEWAVKTDHGICIAPLPFVAAWRVAPRRGVGAELIGSFILSAIGLGGSSLPFLTAAATAQFVGSIVLAAGSIGLQYALGTLNRQRADAQGQQQMVKESAGPRVRHYGQVKLGGKIVFSESVNGQWYQVIVAGSGRMDSVVETWLNDKVVTLAGDTNTTAPWTSHVKIEHRLGLATETAYAALITAFPGKWTADHRGDGLASSLLRLIDPGAKHFGQVYQGGVPRLRNVWRSSLVYDPRDEGHDWADEDTWAWSDNAALCILDFLTHPDGMNIPRNEISLPHFIAFANLCDELVPLKGGGFEKRYRLWGSYSLAAPRKDTLRRMLVVCDAQAIDLPDGKIGIVGGRYQEPEFTLVTDMIVARNWKLGRSAPERANELKPIYVSASHDYQEVEAPAWQDEESVTRDGLVSQQFDVTMCPSHAQAQRLAKIAGRRINAPVTGTVRTTLAGLAAYQQRFIRIVDDRLDLDGVFIVDKFQMEIGRDGMAVSLDVTQVDASDWDWDPETEEGDPTPVPPDTSSDTAVEVPQNVSAIVAPVTISGGVTGGQIEVTWDAPIRAGMVTDVRYRRRISTGPDVWEEYTTTQAAEDATRFASGVIQNDGSLYEVQVRFVVTGGVNGEWATPVSLIATADTVAPDPVSGISATGGAGTIAATWTTPNSANFSGVRLYWNTSNSLTGATLAATVYGSASQSQSRTITGVSAGARWLLITAINGSGVASSAVSASATVT